MDFLMVLLVLYGIIGVLVALYTIIDDIRNYQIIKTWYGYIAYFYLFAFLWPWVLKDYYKESKND